MKKVSLIRVGVMQYDLNDLGNNIKLQWSFENNGFVIIR